MEERNLEHLVHINVTFRIKDDPATRMPNKPFIWTITVKDPADLDHVKKVLTRDSRWNSKTVFETQLIIERVDVLK